jgi:hypothetical protein
VLEIAPPRGLKRAMSGSNSRAHINAIAANASLHSIASKSLIFIPVRSRSLCVTGTGAESTSTGSSAATAKCVNRARIGRPSLSAVSRLATIIADAASFICDELPAVMLGAWSGSHDIAGARPPRISIVVPGRMPSS